jgi:hypothetical protein
VESSALAVESTSVAAVAVLTQLENGLSGDPLSKDNRLRCVRPALDGDCVRVCDRPSAVLEFEGANGCQQCILPHEMETNIEVPAARSTVQVTELSLVESKVFNYEDISGGMRSEQVG